MKSLANIARRWVMAFLYPSPLIGIFFLPRYLLHWFRYARGAKGQRIGVLDLQPCLGDWTTHTPFDAHYFYQGAWLARWLSKAALSRHTDIDSSVLGLPNEIYFPFGCNENISRKIDVPKKYDVSFVGGWHPYREWLIGRIRKAGISVEVFVHRWTNGEIVQEGMVRIFNKSRINLNLSNSASWGPVSCSVPEGNRQSAAKQKIRTDEGANVRGKEKVKFYLVHDALRESIAAAAYQRTMKDHTFVRRFQTVFQRMGLSNEQ